MTRTSLDHHNCSFAQTVDRIGDKWTLMILRDAFYGVRRFGDFKRRIGMTQAVLSARLAKLVDDGLMRKVPMKEDGRREEYRLTETGRDLFPAIVALVQWGDRNMHKEKGAPVELYDGDNGHLLDRIEASSSNAPIDLRKVRFRPGPGATHETILEFELMTRD
jgi:DNA-binding HxlR family transcriptional regulator